ncbi:8-oxo-dGTP diphosphatase MutT [Pontibacter saemangeumensis]|uniref:8-oxo-dGTP diphosphatase n=1 Tax=Pontibacter saemangeumensis TaxID=1084525 RepID=A0ABP8LEB2_9BACT
MITRVTCAVIEQYARVLITQRSKSMPDPLLWEFPGGKVEAGETEEECLVREIREELSLHITPQFRMTPVLHQLGDNPALELIPFRCLYDGGTIQLLEHRNYKWVHPQDLLDHDWCAPDIPVVEEYLRLLKAS